MRQLVIRPRWLILSAALVGALLVISVSSGMALESSRGVSSRPGGFSGYGQNTCNQNGIGGTQLVNGLASDPTSEIASALNLSVNELQQQIASGQSLSQIVSAHHMTTQAVADAATSTLKDQLNQQVASGRMTLEQEDALLASNQSTIDEILEGKTTLPAPGRSRVGFGNVSGGRGRLPNCGG